jgi:hypothetical protein
LKKIEPKPEYSTFDLTVRKPGLAFLASTPHPNNKEWNKNSYWSRAKSELRAAYAGICAYTCRYLVAGGSLDHFIPRLKAPMLAYEWSNFRYCRQNVNSRKGSKEGVLDPFSIEDGWFVLDISSGLISANPELKSADRQKIKVSIDILGLNNVDEYVQERTDAALDFARGRVDFSSLTEQFPYVASEIERQGVRETIQDLFPGFV